MDTVSYEDLRDYFENLSIDFQCNGINLLQNRTYENYGDFPFFEDIIDEFGFLTDDESEDEVGDCLTYEEKQE